MPDSTKTWTLRAIVNHRPAPGNSAIVVKDGAVLDAGQEVEVVEASRLRNRDRWVKEALGERDEAEAERDEEQKRAEYFIRLGTDWEKRALAAEHQLHQERERLREATKAITEVIALRRLLEENAGRMPDERADAYRIIKGSSYWGRAERFVASLTDPEDDVGIGAEGLARPSREARGVRENPGIGADSSADPEPESEPVCERCRGIGWIEGSCATDVRLCPDCAPFQDPRHPGVTRADLDRGEDLERVRNQIADALLDLNAERSKNISLEAQLVRAIKERDSRLTKEQCREKLLSDEAVEADAATRWFGVTPAAARQSRRGLEAAVAAAFGDDR